VLGGQFVAMAALLFLGSLMLRRARGWTLILPAAAVILIAGLWVSRLQAVPIVGAEIQEAFLEQLREDLEAFLVREVKEPLGLRNGRRQTAHVAEFAADPFHKLLIGGTLHRRPRERSHAKRPDRNVKAGMREGEWLVRGGRHDANAPKATIRPSTCGSNSGEALQLSSSETETRSVGEQSRVFRLIRFYKAFKHARQFGFTLLNAYLAARVNSLWRRSICFRFSRKQEMEPFRSNVVYFFTRAVLMLVGALLLWAAPTSVIGLVVMFVGLVCAVSGLALEKTRQF
jgi:hypothetical protein